MMMANKNAVADNVDGNECTTNQFSKFLVKNISCYFLSHITTIYYSKEIPKFADDFFLQNSKRLKKFLILCWECEAQEQFYSVSTAS